MSMLILCRMVVNSFSVISFWLPERRSRIALLNLSAMFVSLTYLDTVVCIFGDDGRPVRRRIFWLFLSIDGVLGMVRIRSAMS